MPTFHSQHYLSGATCARTFTYDILEDKFNLLHHSYIWTDPGAPVMAAEPTIYDYVFTRTWEVQKTGDSPGVGHDHEGICYYCLWSDIPNKRYLWVFTTTWEYPDKDVTSGHFMGLNDESMDTATMEITEYSPLYYVGKHFGKRFAYRYLYLQYF